MRPVLVRALSGALIGAVLAVVAASTGYQFHSTVDLDFDRDRPGVVSGAYGAERVGDETYVWTSRAATLSLAGLDRSVAWQCEVRVKGGRADVSTLPELTLTVDGVITARHQTGNDYQWFSAEVPRAAAPGVVVGASLSNTFRPERDSRDLGVMIDRWRCAPDNAAWPSPPRAAAVAAAAGGAAIGAALALLAGVFWVSTAGSALFAAGQAVAITSGTGVFGGHLTRGVWVSVAGAAVLAICALAWHRSGRRWSGQFRVALAWTVGLAVLKLLVLLHPDKPLIDAQFHAHRVLWVLDGRYFFTQTMPSGVEFPYAIGLYLVAAPWSVLTADLVTVLRLVIVTAEATGGLLLFAMIARVWKDRDAALGAAWLFPLLPLPFLITGNANMTNVFAQALALASVATGVLFRMSPARPGAVIGFTAITCAALLSHISTLTLLLVTLGLLTFAYWWRGDTDLRRSAWVVAGGVVAAGVVAVGVYYIHFVDAFRSALTMRTGAGTSGAAPVLFMERASEAGTLLLRDVGWPIWILALTGMAAARRRAWRDRLDLAVIAWIVTAALSIGLTVLTPVDRPFQRYAAEFVSRVTFATAPAVVILAGLGGAHLWRRGGVWRWAGAGAGVAAVALAVEQWLRWLR